MPADFDDDFRFLPSILTAFGIAITRRAIFLSCFAVYISSSQLRASEIMAERGGSIYIYIVLLREIHDPLMYILCARASQLSPQYFVWS